MDGTVIDDNEVLMRLPVPEHEMLSLTVYDGEPPEMPLDVPATRQGECISAMKELSRHLLRGSPSETVACEQSIKTVRPLTNYYYYATDFSTNWPQ